MVNVWKLGGAPGLPRNNYIPTAVKKQFVSVGWAGISSVKEKDIDQIKGMFRRNSWYRKNYSDTKIAQAARILWKFANLVKGGDIVVLYDNRVSGNQQAYVGIVKNQNGSSKGYYFVEEGSSNDWFEDDPDGDNAPHRVDIRQWMNDEKPYSFVLPSGAPWQLPLVRIDSERLRKIKMDQKLESILKKEISPKRSATSLSELEIKEKTKLTNQPDNNQLDYKYRTESRLIQANKEEAELMLRYENWLADQGRSLKQVRYGNIVCDGYEESTKNLIEAKSSTEREYIRMAVGQLLDYSFQGRSDLGEPNMAILVPKKLEKELEGWLKSLSISVVWRNKNEFKDNAEGRFT